jgi:acyl-CoA synthetase (AMP-forming)/AMP-acid ligase II
MTNLAHNLGTAAASHPARIALWQKGLQFTYAELNAAVARATAWLVDKGVKPGDRVAVMMPNVVAFPIFYYAILRCGGVVVPMNPLFKFREIEYYLGDSGAELALVWADSVHEASLAVSAVGVELIEIDAEFMAMFEGYRTGPEIADRADDDTAVIL